LRADQIRLIRVIRRDRARRHRSGVDRSARVVLEAAHENVVAEKRDRLAEGSARRVQKLEARLPNRGTLLLEEVGRSRAAAIEGSADQEPVGVDLKRGTELRALLGIVRSEEAWRQAQRIPVEDVRGPGVGDTLIIPASPDHDPAASDRDGPAELDVA